MAPREESMDREAHNLMFGIEKSMRYHQRHRGFLEWCHRAIMFGVVVFSSVAMVQIGPVWAGTASVVLAAFDLAIGFGTQARDHQLLFQKFAALNREIRKNENNADAEKLSDWHDARLAIELEEPPILWALEADCYNEVARAWGLEVEQPNVLTWRQRLFMHTWSFESSGFSPRQRPMPA
jgi:hypothetical protein